MSHDPARFVTTAGALEDERAAPEVVDGASALLGLQGIRYGRPGELAFDARHDLDGAVLEPRHLLELGAKMMIAVVLPAAVDPGALEDRKTVTGVQSVQRRQVRSLRRRKHGSDDGRRLIDGTGGSLRTQRARPGHRAHGDDGRRHGSLAHGQITSR